LAGSIVEFVCVNTRGAVQTMRLVEFPSLPPQFSVLRPQPGQLGPLLGTETFGLATRDPVLFDPVGQAARANPQVSRHASYGLVHLTHDPDRFFTELPVKLSSLLRHET
jgi:hypothetical protein